MSSYSMELRDYIEMWSQDTEEMSWKDRIEVGRTKLFDFDYPIFDENYKKDFETHFIRNFYMREIGFEVEGLFKFQLETWLQINMPYWNKMYESELLSYDPLTNSKMDVTHSKTNDKTESNSMDGTSNTTNNGTSNDTIHNSTSGTATDDDFSRKLKSNNPDERLALTANDGQGVIEYASEIEEDNTNNSRSTSSTTDQTNDVTNNSTSDNTTNVTGNSTTDETENFSQHREGKVGVQTYAKMLKEHRESLLRIDKMIFNEMNELFMLVY